MGVVIDRLKRSPARKIVDRVLLRLGPRPRFVKERTEAASTALNESVRNQLAGVFAPEVSRLSEMLGRDLNGLWNIPSV